MSSELLFDTGQLEFIRDPYPTYARMRSREPLYWSARHRLWIATRYADIKFILHDSRLGAPESAIWQAQESGAPAHAVRRLHHAAHHSFDFWMVNRNPPDHTRLRALFAPWFSQSAVEHWRPFIFSQVEQLLARTRPLGGMDVLADFADPLALAVISQIMGIPEEDRVALQVQIRELLGLLGFNRSPLTQARAAMATLDAVSYFERLAGRRAQTPGEDLFSALVSAHSRDGALTRHELAANAVMLMVGGEANTRAAIGNGMLALLNNPGQLAWLRAHPHRIGLAVKELLRYESSKQIVARAALEDVQVGDKLVRKGETVLVLLGAANRDPEAFPEPDRLALERAPNPHLSFGFGIHRCLGAYLAGLELEIALGALVEQFPHLTAETDALEWNDGFFPRGVRVLPVRF